jgi:C-terminal processing protease CtpA/Prc
MGGYSFSTGGLVAPFLKSDYTFHCFAESIGAQDMVMKADPARDFQGRIAILTNEISKSGADFAAYALLHGNVVGEARSFGTPSAGLFSATQFTDISYTLNESSETLQSGVTIEQCANDDGVNLDGSYVDPDERITFQASDIVSGQDPVINRALAWIDGE